MGVYLFSSSGYQDSNLGLLGPKPSALPDCATSRKTKDPDFLVQGLLIGFNIVTNH